MTGNPRDSVDGAGWEVLFVAFDNHARIVFTAMYAAERTSSAVQFLGDAVAYYAKLGVTIKRLLTDNGSAFRSRDFAAACKALGIRHRLMHTRRRPMAKPSASLSLRCASGPPASPTSVRPNELPHCNAGTTTTTGTDRIKASASKSRCPDLLQTQTTS